MTLNDKRKVIEALLCAAGDANNVSLLYAIDATGASREQCSAASDESYQNFPAGTLRVSDRYTEVAYLMIESSPTLRREWFGGGR